jgi:hypothetical protein
VGDQAKVYRSGAEELARRVLELCRAKPEAMDVDSPFGLFKHGLECKDLDPTLGMANAALSAARRKLGWRKSTTEPDPS